MADKKRTIVTIEHRDSGNIEKMSQEEYDQLQDRIKSRYKVTGTRQEAEAPDEVKKS